MRFVRVVAKTWPVITALIFAFFFSSHQPLGSSAFAGAGGIAGYDGSAGNNTHSGYGGRGDSGAISERATRFNTTFANGMSARDNAQNFIEDMISLHQIMGKDFHTRVPTELIESAVIAAERLYRGANGAVGDERFDFPSIGYAESLRNRVTQIALDRFMREQQNDQKH